MNIRSKRFLTVLLTLIFAATVFTVTAFAESVASEPITPESQASSEPAPPSSTAPETSSTAPESSSSAAESSKQASSHESAASSRKETSTPSKSPVSSHAIVDTQTSRVEAAASQAAQALSDPGVLSSENWGELLSSGAETQSQGTAAAGTTTISSTAAPANVGGVSMILILGVILIVLALCGIGLFVYLQFFSNRNGGSGGYGPKDPKNHSAGASKKNVDEPTMTFTDISSDSDGMQHRGDYVPENEHDIRSSSTPAAAAPVALAPKPQAAKTPSAANMKSTAPKPQPAKKAPAMDQDATAPIPQPVLPDRKPVIPTQGVEPVSKAQATPVSNGSDFDWEKFFNDQK